MQKLSKQTVTVETRLGDEVTNRTNRPRTVYVKNNGDAHISWNGSDRAVTKIEGGWLCVVELKRVNAVSGGEFLRRIGARS